MPFRVERDRDTPGETATVSGELVAFQRFFHPGHILRVTVASRDAMSNGSRSAAGFVPQHADDSPATATFPVVRGSTPDNRAIARSASSVARWRPPRVNYSPSNIAVTVGYRFMEIYACGT